MNYLLKAALTTAIVGGLSAALMVKAMGGDHNVEAESHGSGWLETLSSKIEASKLTKNRTIRIKHCGKVRRSDLSISLRKTYKGVRPSILKPNNSDRDHWRIEFFYLNELKLRKVFFTCPDGGSHE